MSKNSARIERRSNMTYEEAIKTLHINDLVTIRSTHKGTLTAVYKVLGMEEIEWNHPSINVKLELVAGSFIDYNGTIGKHCQAYGPGTIRHMHNDALVKVEDP